MVVHIITIVLNEARKIILDLIILTTIIVKNYLSLILLVHNIYQITHGVWLTTPPNIYRIVEPMLLRDITNSVVGSNLSVEVTIDLR